MEGYRHIVSYFRKVLLYELVGMREWAVHRLNKVLSVSSGDLFDMHSAQIA